jgi:hypothetical protein
MYLDSAVQERVFDPDGHTPIDLPSPQDKVPKRFAELFTHQNNFLIINSHPIFPVLGDGVGLERLLTSKMPFSVARAPIPIL